jgi:hypothetical protein
MDVSLRQASGRPGGKANLVTTLTESGVPLGSSVKISCSTTDPLGAVRATDLVQREPGVFALDISTRATGVYLPQASTACWSGAGELTYVAGRSPGRN